METFGSLRSWKVKDVPEEVGNGCGVEAKYKGSDKLIVTFLEFIIK